MQYRIYRQSLASIIFQEVLVIIAVSDKNAVCNIPAAEYDLSLMKIHNDLFLMLFSMKTINSFSILPARNMF